MVDFKYEKGKIKNYYIKNKWLCIQHRWAIPIVGLGEHHGGRAESHGWQAALWMAAHMNSQQLQPWKTKPVKTSEWNEQVLLRDHPNIKQGVMTCVCSSSARRAKTNRARGSPYLRTNRQIATDRGGLQCQHLASTHTRWGACQHTSHIHIHTKFQNKNKRKNRSRKKKKKVKGEGETPSQIFLQSFCTIKDFELWRLVK